MKSNYLTITILSLILLMSGCAATSSSTSKITGEVWTGVPASNCEEMTVKIEAVNHHFLFTLSNEAGVIFESTFETRNGTFEIPNYNGQFDKITGKFKPDGTVQGTLTVNACQGRSDVWYTAYGK